jgi:hypothetical protein
MQRGHKKDDHVGESLSGKARPTTDVALAAHDDDGCCTTDGSRFRKVAGTAQWPRDGGGSPTPGNHTAETGLAGWG